MTNGRGLTSCLNHRDYRLFIGAFTFAGIDGWAYTVALVVGVALDPATVFVAVDPGM